MVPTKFQFIWLRGFRGIAGLDINVCPIPVKTDVGQVDLVLRLSDGTSEKNQDKSGKNHLFPPV